MNEGLLIQNQDLSMHQSVVGQQIKKNRVKPKFFKLLGQIMNDHVEVKYHLIYLKQISLFSVIWTLKIWLA